LEKIIKTKKLCRLCHVNPATVPDRDYPGRPIKRICNQCHTKRLVDDFKRLMEARKRLP